MAAQTGRHRDLPLHGKNMEQAIFYILAAVTIIATVFAITEKHTVHAIVYLVTSFFSLAVIFFLLGAPLVAVFEVIIYAGAIMVLFLFVIMMLDLGHPDKAGRPVAADVWPAVVLSIVTVGAALSLCASQPLAIPRRCFLRHPGFRRGAFQKIRHSRRGYIHAAAVRPGRRPLPGTPEVTATQVAPAGAITQAHAVGKLMIVPLFHILILAVILFMLGLVCVLTWRSNLIMILIGIEIMLNAAMLVFVGGAAQWGSADGQVFALMIMALTSAEVSLALALVVYLHRRRKTVNADEFRALKG